MSPEMIGLVIGAVAGVISWRTLSILSARVDKPETQKLLGIVGKVELVLLPVIGYVIGALAFGESV